MLCYKIKRGLFLFGFIVAGRIFFCRIANAHLQAPPIKIIFIRRFPPEKEKKELSQKYLHTAD